jgi:RNA polymerase sigma-70 factor, ECF subfamily
MIAAPDDVQSRPPGKCYEVRNVSAVAGTRAAMASSSLDLAHVTDVEVPLELDPYAPSPEDVKTVAALKAGDEETFMRLVAEYGPSMLRVALLYVKTRAVAEEVVQDAWLGMLKGIDRFEGRSSLKTWVFRILTNTAKTRAEREGRSLPFSSLSPDDLETGEPSVDADRFLGDDERWARHWSSSPKRFDALPEGRLLSQESMEIVQRAVDSLPEAQRIVLTMRDVVGFDTDDVCDALGISEVNQRVLLHRARTRVRKALEAYVEATDA